MVDLASHGKCVQRKHTRGGFNVPHQEKPRGRPAGQQRVGSRAPGGGSGEAGCHQHRGSREATRVWAAPQVERTGQVLQDRVAPKVSAALSSAARRLEPAKPRRSRWRKLAGASAFTAAASAVAALVRKRRKPDVTTSAAEPDADDVTPAADRRDGQAKTSTDADVNGQVRTS